MFNNIYIYYHKKPLNTLKPFLYIYTKFLLIKTSFSDKFMCKMMQKIYNKKTKHLEFYKEKANHEFWDNHWSNDKLKNKIICKAHPLIKYILDKYSSDKKSKVLEAGCGNARTVYFMDYYGYKNAYGIDYAKKTISMINQVAPHLKTTAQDIRHTNFENNFFDIYFSFGVIEHFSDGYGQIIKEAKRIVKNDGYLAISFPYMSPLRKLKARLNFYKKQSVEKENFYQYAFDLNNTIKNLKEHNLFVVEKIKYSGIKGFKDEINLFRPSFQKLCGYRGKSKTISIIKIMADKIFKIFASHMIMLILRNND